MIDYIKANQKKRKRKVRFIQLFIVGLVFSLFFKYVFDTGWKTFLSDVLFCISMVYFIYGLWLYVLKVGFFNGLIYGTSRFRELLRSELKSSDHLREDYVDFVKERRKREYDISMPLIAALFFLILSILVSLVI